MYSVHVYVENIAYGLEFYVAQISKGGYKLTRSFDHIQDKPQMHTITFE